MVLVMVPALAAAVSEGRAAAADCQVAAPVGEDQMRARLSEIESIFARREPEMRIWFGSFAALHTVMAGASVALAVDEDDPDTRGAVWMGAAGSALALVTLLAAQPPLLRARVDLEGWPDETEDALRSKLAFAEARLRKSAKAARGLRSAWPRILSGVYSLGSAAFVWLAFDRPLGAVQQMGGGILIGQGRISLHPIGIAEDWEQYAQTYGSCDGGAIESASTPSWSFAPSPGGLGLQVRF